MIDYSINPYRKDLPDWSGDFFDFLNSDDMMAFHRSLDGYQPTPLVSLDRLAERLGVKSIVVKDESHRFGIKAFKALGASYAIYRFMKGKWEEQFEEPFTPETFKDEAKMAKLGKFTFTAATDGNHGRAVAWTAKKLKQKAVIYMPDNTAQSRIDNIEGEGAKVELVPGTFDDCVDKCSADAKANGWQEIADTAYPGYMDIPRYIILGYSSVFRELEDSINTPDQAQVDFVFLPAGVGGVASAGAGYYTKRYGADRPKIVCVEPKESDCFLESIKSEDGEPKFTKGNQMSIMAGLNCGMPSLIAWPIMKDTTDLFVAVSDDYALEAMKVYHEFGIVSGESGASCLAGLLALCEDKPELNQLREKLGINQDARIFLLNTEGDTDPVNWKKVTGG